MIRARPCIGKESEGGQNRKLKGQVGPLVDPKRVQVQLSSIRIKSASLLRRLGGLQISLHFNVSTNSMILAACSLRTYDLHPQKHHAHSLLFLFFCRRLDSNLEMVIKPRCKAFLCQFEISAGCLPMSNSFILPSFHPNMACDFI